MQIESNPFQEKTGLALQIQNVSYEPEVDLITPINKESSKVSKPINHIEVKVKRKEKENGVSAAEAAEE